MQKAADALTTQNAELKLQLSAVSDKAEELTVQLQQQKDAESELESQLKTQSAELNVVLKRASNLEKNKRQLQQQLDAVVLDQQQLQSRLEGEKAAAEKELSALKAEIHLLQVLKPFHDNCD